MPVSKVLVVDDSKAELMFLRELLQKQGYAVRTAENADDALRQLASCSAISCAPVCSNSSRWPTDCTASCA
jgi:CheY-like chemotaxis protein